MYLTIGANVSTRRSRTRRSPVSRYSCHSASASSAEIRPPVRFVSSCISPLPSVDGPQDGLGIGRGVEAPRSPLWGNPPRTNVQRYGLVPITSLPRSLLWSHSGTRGGSARFLG